MPKFCGKCGSKLDEKTNLCPKCDATEIAKQKEAEKPKNKIINNAQQNRPANKSLPAKQTSEKQKKSAKKKADKLASKRAKKADKKAKKAARSPRQKAKAFLAKLVAIIISSIILFIVVTGVLAYFNIVDIPFFNSVFSSMGIKGDDTEDNIESYKVTPPDADDYFNNNSKVLSEVNVNDSKDVMTEAETSKNLTDRGFTQYSITTEYSMDGEYSDATDISDSSSSKHPMYQTYYVSKYGDVWTIFLINNVVMANPVSYNQQSTRGVQLVISESESVTSYDSTTNKFYETIPNESELIVKKVSRIDKDTLDNLTIGGIDKL